MAKAELLLHPVRLRIALVLVGRRLTTEQIGRALPDVPPASLYRHVRRLREGGVVSVAAEGRGRGAVHRLFTVPAGGGLIDPADPASLDAAAQMRLFTAFTAALAGAYGRYLAKPGFDLGADGVRYRQTPLFLDDREHRVFLAELDAVLERAMAHAPAPGRRPRLFTHAVFPAGRGEQVRAVDLGPGRPCMEPGTRER